MSINEWQIHDGNIIDLGEYRYCDVVVVMSDCEGGYTKDIVFGQDQLNEVRGLYAFLVLPDFKYKTKTILIPCDHN